MVHLALLVRQLPRTVTAGRIHNRRRHNLLVTGLAGFRQEKVDQGALQLGTFSAIYGETGSGNLYTQIEIYQVIFLGQFPVREPCTLYNRVRIPVAYGVFSNYALFQITLHYPVVLGT